MWLLLLPGFLFALAAQAQVKFYNREVETSFGKAGCRWVWGVDKIYKPACYIGDIVDGWSVQASIITGDASGVGKVSYNVTMKKKQTASTKWVVNDPENDPSVSTGGASWAYIRMCEIGAPLAPKKCVTSKLIKNVYYTPFQLVFFEDKGCSNPSTTMRPMNMNQGVQCLDVPFDNSTFQSVRVFSAYNASIYGDTVAWMFDEPGCKGRRAGVQTGDLIGGGDTWPRRCAPVDREKGLLNSLKSKGLYSIMWK